MAITTNGTIEEYGTRDAVDDTSTSAITDGTVSAAADITAWTNTDDSAQAQLVLLWQYASGTISGSIDIHIRPINVDGTNDTPVPTTTDPIGYAGSFNIATGQAAATDTAYTKLITLTPFSTKTSQEYEIYLINNTGVTIAANWDLDIVPKAYNGAA